MLINLLILVALASVVTMVLVLMCCAAGARADVDAEALAEEPRVDVVGVERAVQPAPPGFPVDCEPSPEPPAGASLSSRSLGVLPDRSWVLAPPVSSSAPDPGSSSG